MQENAPQDHCSSHPQTSTLTSEFLKLSPAIELPNKPYSLQPDIAMGWIPKMKIIGPVPLNFDCAVTDHIMSYLVQHKSLVNYFRVAYLGSRPHNTFRMHEDFTGFYRFRYEHLYKNNYSHLQPFYKKFYGEFQTKSQRPFTGMNPALTQNQTQVVFDSSFEGGNLDAAVRVAKGQYDLFIRIDSNTRGHLQWYYFRVKNVSLQKIKINIVNFQRKRTLYQRGMKPFVKVGDGEWAQGGLNISFKEMILRYEFLKDEFYESDITLKQLSFEHKFAHPHEQVQFAYSIPYGYSRVVRLAQQLSFQSRSQILKQKILCQSLSGLDLQLLTITDPDIPNKGKKCIFAIGRQHPGESNGSYVMEGFLKWVCSDTPEAARLRQIAVVKVVPMVNPDGVVLGNFRTSICGKDLNRLFKKKNTFMFPEVQEIKQEIVRTKKEFKDKFLLFMDFHGHSIRKNVFTYGPGFFLGENNYYKSRMFPKIISNQTKMFRYYSCSFRISEHKQSTARALISKYVPYCYTVQTSNSSYYCEDNRTNIDFTANDWLVVGKEIGVSSLFYLEMIIDEQRQAKFRLDKIKQKKEARQQRHTRDIDYETDESKMMSSTKRSTKSGLTAKSLGSKRMIKQTLQMMAGNTVVPPVPSSPNAGRHYPPLPSVITLRRYNHKAMIDEIKQMEQNLTQIEKQDDDNLSDKFEEGGSDSQSQSDDLPDQILKKFHKGATRMMLQFQNVFFKRHNSQLNTTTTLNSPVKKRKPAKEKQKKVQTQRQQVRQIPVMACLKSKVYPLEQNKLSKLQKFKSFQILEPLGKTSSIKQIITQNRQKIPSALLVKQPLPKPLKRNLNTRNTVYERLDKVDQQFIKFQHLAKIDEESDNHFSGKISACVRELDHTDAQQRMTGTSKLSWLNSHLPRRDRRSEYMELARERLQQYLIRENVNGTFDREFLGTKIRVRNVSKTDKSEKSQI